MSLRRLFNRRTLGYWAILALLPILSHRTKAQAPPTETLTFASVADTYVDAGSATTNFGTNASLKADASPVRIIYLRFAVTGVNGRAVQSAKLRLGVTGASD